MKDPHTTTSTTAQTSCPRAGRIYIEPTIRTIAGGIIITLGTLMYFVEQHSLVLYFVLLFVGVNLFQSGLSGFCVMEKMLKMAGLASELDEIRSLSNEIQLISNRQAAYLDTLNLLNEAVMELSPEGRILATSDGWLRLSGETDHHRSCNRPLTDYLADSDHERLTSLLDRLNQQTGNTRQAKFRLVTRDGEIKWVSGNFMRVSQDGRPSIKGVLTDISESKRLEEERRKFHQELTHARRLSNLGEMAAGLAHELNQPLAAVNLYIQGCLQRLDAPPENPEQLRNAMQAAGQQAKRAGEIIKQIRNFVRKRPFSRLDTDINELIRDSLNLLDSEPGRQDIHFKPEFGERLPPVAVDRLQIQQVLINLISNAADAMEGVQQDRLITLRTRFSAGNVVVEIEDRGRGIPEEIADQLFEPFVTGRKDGLGLGLAISRSIIEEHGGTLWYSSLSNGGSCFSFTLPAENGDSEND
ncbi:MAG TPA: PAS domain S-box protein [Gammaproteobacteria bacterium]|nr:PAS domain S-box protein [Gammaproteobacteria bacterium]